MSGVEVMALGIMERDSLFLSYWASVLGQMGWSREDVERNVQEHLARLVDANPTQAMEYRQALLDLGAKNWPAAARHDFRMELERPWVPTARDEQRWRQLPPHVRESYMGQGAVEFAAMLDELAGPG